jgi:acyl carrier protein
MPDNITEKVLDLIADTKRIPREQVSPTSTFEELGLDSLDAINLVFEVESTFNISVPDSVANSMTSVPQVVEELRKILATQSTSQQTPPGCHHRYGHHQRIGRRPCRQLVISVSRQGRDFHHPVGRRFETALSEWRRSA